MLTSEVSHFIGQPLLVIISSHDKAYYFHWNHNLPSHTNIHLDRVQKKEHDDQQMLHPLHKCPTSNLHQQIPRRHSNIHELPGSEGQEKRVRGKGAECRISVSGER